MTETDRLLREALPTLLLGAAGAALFWALSFPAAVITGPAAVVSVATLMGLRSHVPARLRDAVLLVLGVSIGSTVTPEVIETALAWPVSLAVLSATLLIVMATVRTILMRVFAQDSMTALLSATPGHLSYVLGLSTELRADVPQVALVQSVRVLLLTLLVPVLVSFWGAEGTSAPPDHGTISAMSAAAVFSAALLLGLVFRRFGVPAPLLLGGMAASAFGHGADLTPGVLPGWATTVAFVVMGSLIGTRFRGLGRQGLVRGFAAGVVVTVLSCAIAALGAVVTAEIVDLPPAALLLAFAPGGVEVMAALAVETSLEPAFVAAHHVFRLVLLSIIVPVVLARERRR